jgi:predicted Ser/Thr protein kinase
MEMKIVKAIDQTIIDFVTYAVEECKRTYNDYLKDNSFSVSRNSVKTLKDFLGKRIGGGYNSNVYEYKGYIVKEMTGRPQFCQDGRMLTILNGSPYFPTVYAYNDKFMIAERIHGVTALDYNPKLHGKLSPDFKRHLEDAFAYADSKGVELSDLKQDNIMINEKGLPVIVDAGTFNVKGEHKYSCYHEKQCMGWVDTLVRMSRTPNKVDEEINDWLAFG